MTETVTWLHISDTHFCKEKHGWKSDEIFRSFFEDLEYMKNEYQLSPDLVFFTGDIALGHINNSKGFTLEDQYEEAKEFLNKILKIFSNLDISKIFIVPGNHDINRTQSAEYQTEWLESLKKENRETRIDRINKLIINNNQDWKWFMARLNEYKEFLEKCSYKQLLGNPDNLMYSKKINIHGFELGIVGLNSAWSSYGGDEDKRSLWLGTYQIHQSYNNIKDTMFSIAISHHPSNWFTEYEDATISHEIKNKFNFYLHGHEHRDWVSTIDKKHIHIASGAIFSGSEYSGSEQKCGYNFVRLYPLENKAEVFLRTYNDGWVPNVIGRGKTDNNGICNLENLCINIDKAEIQRSKTNDSSKDSKEIKLVSPEPIIEPNPYKWNFDSLDKKIKDDIINNEKEFNILVLGDVMLDRTMYVIDAPYYQVAEHDDVRKAYVLLTEDTIINNLKITSSDRLSLGGAAGTVTALLEIPNVHVDMVGIRGEDLEGKKIKELFNNLNNSTHSEFYDVFIDEYPTVTKCYYHQINRHTTGRVSATERYDREDKKLIKEHIEEYIENFNIVLRKIEKILEKKDRKYDCIVVNDYEKGMINSHTIKWLEKIQVKYQNIPIFVDPKYNFERYKNIRIKAIIPNIKETSMGIRKIAGLEEEDVEKRVTDSELNDKDYETLKGYLFNCDSFIIKSDKKGATIYSKDNNYSKVSVPSYPIKLVRNNRDNNIGCGDTFDAYFIIGQLKGYSLQTSVNLANIAAGIKRNKELGEVVSPKEVYNEIISFNNKGSK